MPGFFILLPPHLRPGSLVNRASDSGSEGRGFESHPGHTRVSEFSEALFYGIHVNISFLFMFYK